MIMYEHLHFGGGLDRPSPGCAEAPAQCPSPGVEFSVPSVVLRGLSNAVRPVSVQTVILLSPE